MKNENSGSGFLQSCLMVALVIVAVFGGMAVWSLNTDTPQQIAEQLHDERMAALPKNDQQYALDKQAEVATNLGADMVAVAASADISQTAIARTISSSLWAVASIILGLFGLSIMAFLWGNSRKHTNVHVPQETRSEKVFSKN